MGYSIPSATAKSVTSVDILRGIDYTSDPGNVSIYQSPNAPNMVRDVPGKVRKSRGWYIYENFDGAINGRHKLIGDTCELIHAGKKLYKYEDGTKTLLYSNMANNRSRSWQLNGKLVIQDGKKLLIWNGTSVSTAESQAYVPTLTISKYPWGGGDVSESFNLLSPYYTESFLATPTPNSDGTAGTEYPTDYCMSLVPLDEDCVPVAEVMDADGDWQQVVCTVQNREEGIIRFAVAPGASPVTGEDNVRITVKHTVAGYADRINKCTISILYGVNGLPNRLFVSGNPDSDLLNYDWWSGLDDPTYWPDDGYGTLGGAKSAIIGYAIVGNHLAAFKDKADPDRSVVLRNGTLVENEAVFAIYNTLQGPGAIAPYSFAYLNNEPLFLTENGVYAITTSDVTGDKYQQNRSYYIDKVLKARDDLKDAYCCIFNDQYILCFKERAYILDGLQSISEKNTPYSTRQYCCFERTNLPARIMWEDDGLCFGTADGKLCKFYKNIDSPASYSDGIDIRTGGLGKKITCCWETPDLSGHYFFKRKSFRWLAIEQKAAVYSSVEMYGMRKGLWKLLFGNANDYFRFSQLSFKNVRFASDKSARTGNVARYLLFSAACFSKFVFSSDYTNRTLHTKVKLKKLDHTRFRFINDEYEEPFGLISWATEYVEKGNYKG